MSPSVITLPVRNFKFLTEGSLERRRNYRFCEKNLFAFRDRFPERLPGWGHEWIPACGMHRALLLVVGRIDHRSIVDRPNPCPVMGWRHSVGQALKLLLEIASLREGHG
jgi:hypothetical protein